MLGTITTMAPEVMRKQPYGLKADIWSIGVIFFQMNQPYGLKADIWSIGVIVFQMVFGKPPFSSVTYAEMYAEIQSYKLLSRETLSFNKHTASKEVTTFLKQVLVIESK